MSVDLGKRTGHISLEKDQKVTIEKGVINATVSFSDRTDYDVYAIALDRSGKEHHIATFGAQGIPRQMDACGISHMGDIRRGGGSATGLNTETLSIIPQPEIEQIAICVYSAQSNGTGSFRKYQVSMEVVSDNGDSVSITAREANAHDNVYTCVPAIIRNTENGLEIEQVEMYSQSGSENRPAFKKDGLLKHGRSLAMDAGARNDYK